MSHSHISNTPNGAASAPLTRRAFMRLSAFACLGVASSGLLLNTGCTHSAKNILHVGVKIDVPNFGYQDPATGNIEGLEVDIARELAKRLYGDEKNISITGVNVTTRGAMLDTGVLDATLATFTITEARKKAYNFTEPYYTDFIGVLVPKDSKVYEFKDLDGMTIGVSQSATTRKKLEELAGELGIKLNFSEYATYPEIKVALVSGRVDAFSVDTSILKGYVDAGTRLLDTDLGKQDYGIASSKKDPEFSAKLDELLADMKADGTLKALINKWGLTSHE